MAKSDHDTPDRIFTLAGRMNFSQLNQQRFTTVRRAKTVIANTKNEIQKASANASLGGGSSVRATYISGPA